MKRFEHLLWVLSEECNEVGQRASKAARFGLQEIEPGQTLNNAERIIGEYADLAAAFEMLTEEGYLPPAFLRELIDAKKVKVERFLRYSQLCGTLTPECLAPVVGSGG